MEGPLHAICARESVHNPGFSLYVLEMAAVPSLCFLGLASASLAIGIT